MNSLGRVVVPTPDRWMERETEQLLTINNDNNNGTLSEQESSRPEGGSEIPDNQGGDVPEVLFVDDPAEAAEILEEWTEATAEHDAEWFQQQEQQQQQQGEGDNATTTLPPTPVPVGVGDPTEGTFL